MQTLFLLMVQLVLSLLVLTAIYLLVVFVIIRKNKKIIKVEPNVAATNQIPRLHKIALLYTKPVNEKAFIKIINNLLQQHYSNFKAYFISTDTFLKYNRSDKYLVFPKKTGISVPEQLKQHIDIDTDAVVLLEPTHELNQYFLIHINKKLNEGFEVIQSELNRTATGMAHNYLAGNKALYDFIDRSLAQELNLPASINDTGYALSYKIFCALDADLFIKDAKLVQAKLTDFLPRQGFYADAKVNKHLENDAAFWKLKLNHYKVFFNNQWMGINLLLKGIITGNKHKIYFGMQYLRPPLMGVGLCSLLLLFINIKCYDGLRIFSLIALMGIAVSLVAMFLKSKIIQKFVNT
jgi:hypothetical protein